MIGKHIYFEGGLRPGFYKIVGISQKNRPIVKASVVHWESGQQWRKVGKAGKEIDLGMHSYRTMNDYPKEQALVQVTHLIASLESSLDVLREMKREIETEVT